MCESRILLDGFAYLVATLARHDDIREDDVRYDFACHHNGVIAVIRGHDLHVFVGE